MKKIERTILYEILIILLCVFLLNMSGFLVSYCKQEEKKSQNIRSPHISIWDQDGVPICVLEQDQTNTHIVKDGEGGAIIVWIDDRNGHSDIYAQRIDANGTILWTENGISICTNSYDKYHLNIINDNFGGAFITWAVEVSGVEDIYAQRIDRNGNLLWGTDAVPVCIEPQKQRFPTLCRDGDNGTIIAWSDWRNSDVDIYAQKLDADGNSQWNDNGIVVCDAIENQIVFDICVDGEGGAIIVWEDQRNGLNRDIYSQRINSSGIEQWDANGEVICMEIDRQYSPTIINNGTHGAFIGWYDNRSLDFDIYIQYINATGDIQWENNGKAICTEKGDQIGVLMCSDNTGGIILAWQDERNSLGSYYDLYTQRLNASGDIQWGDNGSAFCVHHEKKYLNSICSGGSEGVILTWEDQRNVYPFFDVYAQKMDNDGNMLWDVNGTSVCSAYNSQFDLVVCPDNEGGGFFSWADWRNIGNERDIYALRFNSSGLVPCPLPSNDERQDEVINGSHEDNNDDEHNNSTNISGYNLFIIVVSMVGIVVVMIKIKIKNKK